MTPKELVNEAARKALKEADGVMTDAAVILVREVEKNETLRHAVLDPLLYSACYEVVRRCVGDNRCEAWNGSPVRQSYDHVQAAKEVRETSGSHRDRLLSIVTADLLMFPLPGGKVLGEATREEVMAGAVWYATRAKDMAHKARWLKAVADGMGNAATVIDVFNAETLTVMQKAAA